MVRRGEASRQARRGKSYIFQRPNFAQNPLDLIIILALQLVQHRVAVLPLAIRRRRSVASSALPGVEVTRGGSAVAVPARAGGGRGAGVAAVVAGEELGPGVALMERGCAESGEEGWSAAEGASGRGRSRFTVAP